MEKMRILFMALSRFMFKIQGIVEDNVIVLETDLFSRSSCQFASQSDQKSQNLQKKRKGHLS